MARPDAAARVRKSAVLMGYPWSMRPSSFTTIGSHHIVVTEEMHRGRWHRMPGDALCKPRSKFRDLDTDDYEARKTVDGVVQVADRARPARMALYITRSYVPYWDSDVPMATAAAARWVEWF